MLYGYSQENSEQLNDEEKRVILSQLVELKASRATIQILEQYISRESEQDIKEKENSDRALELEKQATELANKERDLYKDKAETYEQLYRALTKKPGFGCWVKRIFSLGIARCQ